MRNRAFTLIELLAVICIIGVLAALVVAALSQIKSQGYRAVAISQMRQIGQAIMQYASDNSAALPGPLSVGQGVIYDPVDGTQMATILGDYLGVKDLEQKSLVKVFLPPAYEKAMRNAAPVNFRTYIMRGPLEPNGKSRPWGIASGATTPPMRSLGLPSNEWAFADADQLNPQVIKESWAKNTPDKVVHGAKRLAWFFDGHVDSVTEKTLKDTGPNDGGGGPPPPPPPPPPHKK